MSSLLYRLGRATYRHHWRTLAVWLTVLVVIGGAAGAFSKSFDDGFRLPGTQSQEALDALQRNFPQAGAATAQLIFVAPPGDSVRDREITAAIEKSIKSIATLPGVDSVVSPYDKLITGVINDSENAAIISVQFSVAGEKVTEEAKEGLSQEMAALQAQFPDSRAEAGGDVFSKTGVHVSYIEGIGVVVALVVLLLTLGSFRAAGMPLLTAILGVAISMAMIVLSTAFASVNSSTPMLALMLGLAVGIDYALFIVSRHRDQLADGMEPEESAARAVATSGSAVVFAGLTVMIALSGLAVARIPFLATMGYAAAIAVGLAVVIALTLLPALLGFAGAKLTPKPKRERPVKAKRQGAPARPKLGFAMRWVRLATKWPAVTIAVVVGALGALSLPAGSLQLALPDNGTAELSSPARTTYDLVAEHFGEGYNGPLIVTADIIGTTDPLGVMAGIADDIRALPGVAQIPLATPNQTADTGIVQVIPTSAPDSPETTELVQAIRDLHDTFKEEYGVETAVTGITAIQIDVSTQLGKALLPFGLLVVGMSLILLMMVFRSIAVPLKATIGYLLSVGASFGTVALVFTHGWFNGVLNVDQTGPVISFLPIILMGILFGLAMDYELFLVSRMREDFVHSGLARESVETGFVASAKVVIAAGVIMFSVFAFFVPEGDSIMKAIALGLAVGIFIDAFIVRMTLVPAVMALLGDRAWYLPKWLDKLLPSFDVEGESLHHQLALADWPTPDSKHAIYAEGLTAIAKQGAVFHDVNIELNPGEVLTVESKSSAARSGLLLALSGRLQLDSGRAKVAGLVLPEQAGAIRARTAVIDGASDGLPDQLAKLIKKEVAVILIDRADLIQGGDDRHALAQLLSLHDHPAVVLGVSEVATIAELLPSHSWQLSLDEPAPTTDRSEVVDPSFA